MNHLTVRTVAPLWGATDVVAWFIDDQPLAELLHADGCEWAKDTVLALDGLIDDAELALAWAAALPAEGDVTVLPVTACWSDRDLDCSSYAVEVGRLDGEIVWSRAGRTEKRDDHATAAWEPRFRGYRFTEDNYLAVLAETRRLAAPDRDLRSGHPGFRVGDRWRVRETFWSRPRIGIGQPGVSAGAILRVVGAVGWERPPWAWAVLDDGGRFEPNELFPDHPVADDAAVFLSPGMATFLEAYEP